MSRVNASIRLSENGGREQRPANIPQAPSRPFIHELPNDWEQILNRVALGARKSDTIMRALLEELRRIQPRNVS